MRRKIIGIIILTIITIQLYAQNGKKPLVVYVTTNKTTHLAFRHSVDYFDFGSTDIGVKNTDKPTIIKLKAATENFPETNLTVMTVNNVFYSILVRYQPSPAELNYFYDDADGIVFQAEDQQDKTALKKEKEEKQAAKDTASKLDKNVQLAISKTNKSSQVISGIRRYKVNLFLNKIYIKNDLLYFICTARNSSTIPYDVDFIKFMVRSKSRMKKSSVQEVEKTAKFLHGIPTKIERKDDDYVFAFVMDKFTLTDDKVFTIDLWEENGERSIVLDIASKDLLKAEVLE